MPASSATETAFTVAAGSSFTQADDGASGRPSALTNRYKVRIVNTSATAADRLYVRLGTGAAPTAGETGAVVEPDYGVWEEFVETAVHVFVRCASSNGIYVFFTQYAVS